MTETRQTGRENASPATVDTSRASSTPPRSILRLPASRTTPNARRSSRTFAIPRLNTRRSGRPSSASRFPLPRGWDSWASSDSVSLRHSAPTPSSHSLLWEESGEIREYYADPEATDIARDERHHERVLKGLARGQTGPVPLWEESRSATGASGNIRAAVLGMNDGLVSNFSLVMGVSGGTDNTDFILLAGVAGLLAGAFSMAAGEYVSMRSQRDIYEHEIEKQRIEIRDWPDEEQATLDLIYQSKGLTEAEADLISRRVMADAEAALDTMAREDLGLDPNELGSPWGRRLCVIRRFCRRSNRPDSPLPVQRREQRDRERRPEHCGPPARRRFTCRRLRQQAILGCPQNAPRRGRRRRRHLRHRHPRRRVRRGAGLGRIAPSRRAVCLLPRDGIARTVAEPPHARLDSHGSGRREIHGEVPAVHLYDSLRDGLALSKPSQWIQVRCRPCAIPYLRFGELMLPENAGLHDQPPRSRGADVDQFQPRFSRSELGDQCRHVKRETRPSAIDVEIADASSLKAAVVYVLWSARRHLGQPLHHQRVGRLTPVVPVAPGIQDAEEASGCLG